MALNFNDLVIRQIPAEVAYQLVQIYHYSKVMPKLTKISFGGFINNKLEAAVTFGYGVRPYHTINKLFPSLSTKDYLEIGKLCLNDDLPKNSESYFLTRTIKLVKAAMPNVKIIYTWADGMMGKPGYIYQACNFLYGGFITTDRYISNDGEQIHPRSSRQIIEVGGGNPDRVRPTFETMENADIRHYTGKQFRYALFVCGKPERKRLLKESTVDWSIDYPKEGDLAWRVKRQSGWSSCDMPLINPLAHKYHTLKIGNGETQMALPIENKE